MAFDDAGTVGERHAGEDGVPVLAQESGEAPYRAGPVGLGLADPGGQEVAAAVADQAGEDAGQVTGGGDVRAGDACLVELGLLVSAQRGAWAHDPGRELARAGNRPGGFGGRGAFPQAANVETHGLVVPAEAVLADLPVDLGRIGAAVGETLLDVGTVGVDLAGAAVAGRRDQY